MQEKSLEITEIFKIFRGGAYLRLQTTFKTKPSYGPGNSRSFENCCVKELAAPQKGALRLFVAEKDTFAWHPTANVKSPIYQLSVRVSNTSFLVQNQRSSFSSRDRIY